MHARTHTHLHTLTHTHALSLSLSHALSLSHTHAQHAECKRLRMSWDEMASADERAHVMNQGAPWLFASPSPPSPSPPSPPPPNPNTGGKREKGERAGRAGREGREGRGGRERREGGVGGAHIYTRGLGPPAVKVTLDRPAPPQPRVLICTPSNSALDEIVTRIASLRMTDARYKFKFEEEGLGRDGFAIASTDI